MDSERLLTPGSSGRPAEVPRRALFLSPMGYATYENLSLFTVSQLPTLSHGKNQVSWSNPTRDTMSWDFRQSPNRIFLSLLTLLLNMNMKTFQGLIMSL